MGKARNPTTLAAHFEIDPNLLNKMGVLNPTLQIDTKLFIDPLLLEQSRHVEISKGAREEYEKHFTKIIKLLSASTVVGDVAWRNAERLFEFHEIRGTCIGYGAGSIFGSGFGPELIHVVMQTGKEIVDLGVEDPDLFSLLALFEAGIGPDRISDMVTNVIIGSLIEFNSRVITKLGLNGEQFNFLGKSASLLCNPLQSKRTPIILLPNDVLRPLPIAMDWDGVCAAASHNSRFRTQVNEHIAHIWAAKTERDKKILKEQALQSRKAFQTLLDMVHEVPLTPYDLPLDPEGLIRWAPSGENAAEQFPLEIKPPQVLDLESVFAIVRKIVAQFRFLVEAKGLAENLWSGGKPLHESFAQKLFFAVAYSYCKANNIDISPELDTGSGHVDFKLSQGFDSRVLVEVKLSTNRKVVAGYEKQLEVYKEEEETMRAIYLVIDVGGMGEKDKALIKLRNDASGRGYPLSELEFVEGKPRPGPSTL